MAGLGWRQDGADSPGWHGGVGAGMGGAGADRAGEMNNG